MKYEAKVLMPGRLMSVINGYLNAACQDDCQGEDNTISVTVHFPDGCEMDIKCCGDTDEASWTEAVLFAPTGGSSNGVAEVGCTEPDDSFEGEWFLEHGGNTYHLMVTDGGDIGQPFLAPISDAGEPLSCGWSIG